MGVYAFDSGGFYVGTVKANEPLYHCERGNHDAPAFAFQYGKSGGRFTSCIKCMQEARMATLAARGITPGGKPITRPEPERETPEIYAEMQVTIVDDDSVSVALELVTMLRESRAEILSLRDWLSMEAEASAFLSGADLFIYKDGRIWARRPNGSNVEDPIEAAAVRMLAGDRVGIVFF